MRVDEYDWQTFLGQVELVLEDGGELLGVFPLSDSPEKINDERDPRPKTVHLSILSLVWRGLKLQKLTRMTTLLQKFPNIFVMTLNTRELLD